MPKTKEERLSIRTSERDKSILEQAAIFEHLTMSQFVLQSSLARAITIIKTSDAINEQTRFVIPADKWEKFCERLDAPPRDLPVLRALFGEPDFFND